MKKVKLKSLKKWIVPVLAASILTTCVGCSRNNDYKTPEYEESNIKVESVDKDIQQINENEVENVEVNNNSIDSVVLDDNSTDLEELKQYGIIEYLELNNTNITDFSVLKNIKVKQLQIVGNKSNVDISQFNLKEMQSIYLQDTNAIVNNVNNEDLKNLEEITMINTGLKNANFLQKCSKLKTLNLSSNYLDNVNFLDNMKLLEVADLSNNRIKDLSGIESCTNLDFVSFEKNNIRDISELSDVSNIGYLNLNFNQIEDISVLRNMKRMYSLNITDNGLTDISSIKNIETLKNIDLSRNNITNVPTNIINEDVKLDLKGNVISNISEDVLNEISVCSNSSINLFDNYLNTDTIKKLSKYNEVKYQAEYAEFTPDQYIDYTNKIDYIINSNIESDMSDDEKVMSIYKYFMNNGTIDSNFESPNKYNEYGAIMENKAVCEGYAMALNTMIRRVGIDSKLYYCDLYTLEDKYDHCINIINTDGKNRLYDLTREIDENNKTPKHYGFSNEEAVEQGYYLLSNNIPRITPQDSITDKQINNLFNQEKDIMER